MSAAKAKPDLDSLYCSFCRRSAHQVDKLVAGPGVHICDACIATCVKVIKGKPTPGFAGWATLGEDELLASLASAGACVSALDLSIHDQVQALRDRDVSWQRIADELGVTRQAAQQRFGS